MTNSIKLKRLESRYKYVFEYLNVFVKRFCYRKKKYPKNGTRRASLVSFYDLNNEIFGLWTVVIKNEKNNSGFINFLTASKDYLLEVNTKNKVNTEHDKVEKRLVFCKELRKCKNQVGTKSQMNNYYLFIGVFERCSDALEYFPECVQKEIKTNEEYKYGVKHYYKLISSNYPIKK